MAHKLVLPAVLESLHDIASYVTATGERAGLTPRDTYRLRLAVDEIATNIVTYAYEGEPGELEVEAGLDDCCVWVRLEDSGRPYDPTRRSSPDLSLPLAERRAGGLGIYLSRLAVDDFSYAFVDGKNRNTLVVHRAATTTEGTDR